MRNSEAGKIGRVNSERGCITVTTANPLFSLDGRVALITGASRGLGLAMAEGLAEAGAAVIANGRNADTLEVGGSEFCVGVG